MPIRVALHHRTIYHYDRLVTLVSAGHPAAARAALPHADHRVFAEGRTQAPLPELAAGPAKQLSGARGFPGTACEHFSVEVDLVAEMTVINPFDFFLEPYAEKFPFRYEPALEHELAPFREVRPAGPAAGRVSEDHRLYPTQRTIDFLVALNQQLQREIGYSIRMEPGVQSSEETLTLKSGSCRDSRLAAGGDPAPSGAGGALRLRLPDPVEARRETARRPARAVSRTSPICTPGPKCICRARAGSASIPTSGLLAGEGHIPLAATPEAGLRRAGFRRRGRVRSDVRARDVGDAHSRRSARHAALHRRAMAAHPTLWAAGSIRTSAPRDIRLTMGGEPTFVSIDDMDGAEWNIAALGPEKRMLAERLLDRLRKRFAPGGLLHYGQGKWYPGEPLPRWALTCYWRTDGVPLWHDRALLAREQPGHDFGPLEARPLRRDAGAAPGARSRST